MKLSYINTDSDSLIFSFPFSFSFSFFFFFLFIFLSFLRSPFCQFKNLEKPYDTKCSKKKLKTFSTYTSEGCLYECEVAHVINKCGCRPAGYRGRRRSYLQHNFSSTSLRKSGFASLRIDKESLPNNMMFLNTTYV